MTPGSNALIPPLRAAATLQVSPTQDAALASAGNHTGNHADIRTSSRTGDDKPGLIHWLKVA